MWDARGYLRSHKLWDTGVFEACQMELAVTVTRILMQPVRHRFWDMNYLSVGKRPRPCDLPLDGISRSLMQWPASVEVSQPQRVAFTENTG